MKKRRKLLWNIRLIFCILGLVFSWLFLPCSDRVLWAGQESICTGDMAVHFLDVGQGLAILVQSQGENLIYDGGGRETSSYVVSYLKKQQITEIDYLISSHYDEDHVSGLIGCLNAFTVRNVIGSDYVQESSLYESFMNAVQEQGLEVQHPEVGTVFPFGTGSFTILGPVCIGEESNGNSVVIKLTNGASRFVFTGDADAASEADMINAGLDLDCDVLSVGHHGSATSTSWDFLQAAVPEYGVISCGKDNEFGHPHKDTMDKLSAMDIPVFRNDIQGTVIAVSDGTQISWNQEPCNDYSPGKKEADKVQAVQSGVVWLSATGSTYHRIPGCGNMNPAKARQISREEAEAAGYKACKKCW